MSPPNRGSSTPNGKANGKRASPGRAEVVSGREGGLGTFGGVFTPSILTILGVIMYLRLGWVVGQVGLAATLLIVTLSTLITFLTALSVAAIATDQRVRTGGAYYMISRSLGIETGGAVGIPLFLAQGLSVALYTVGFAESVVATFPALSARWVGVVTTLAVAGLALTSARAAIRSQYVIMAAIALSLLSLLFGSPLEGTVAQGLGEPAAAGGEAFWVVFAVFFPAVTGIMAGVNMSGDLEEPGRAIPRGTFAAIGVGYVIYMVLPIALAYRADTAALVEDPLVMQRIALWGDAILLGVWGATLSSAVGSILGAPRVLQALARDGILPRPLRWLGSGSGPEDTPRLGTLVTLGIALVAVWFGDLNVIAPVLTMFFLTTYGVLNVAAGIERFLGSPSFRPLFKVHWAVSLMGTVGCAGVMFLINPAATVVAVIFVVAIFIFLERQGLEAAWGDVRRGVWMALTRAGLLQLRRAQEDPRNWRPHFLVLSGAPTHRWHLIELAADFSHHNKGLLTVATILSSSEGVTHDRKRAMERQIQEYLGRRGIDGLVRVVSAQDPFAGTEILVEAYGLGPLVPNTVLLGDSEREAVRDRYCAMVQHFWRSKRNVVIVRDADRTGFGERSRVDIWWGGLQGNGALLMILGYLLKTSLTWQSADVRLKMVVPNESAAEDARRNLSGVLAQTRTGLVPQVLVARGRSFLDILEESSQGADLVLMGLAAPDDMDFAAYYSDLKARTSHLPCTVFVLAAEDVAFREVLFREMAP
ncbi:MAG: Na-K-Cl cotransporter [Gemmatimonadota bacterium]